MSNNQDLIALAKDTLIKNDLGGYTVPTHGLYPFQWNWDSAIVALGWLTFDEKRAWQEVTSLLSAQWENGMVPHVVFHKNSETYFPGPDIWGVKRNINSTSISQPPVLATVVSELYEKGKDRELARKLALQVLPQLLDYHMWWYQKRDPENTGLIVSYHPWESGMDNSPSWDKSLAAVPEVDWEYTRRDTNHIDASQRPHKKEYDRFLYLVDFFKKNNFDDHKIYENSPYKVNEIGIISILHRATADLLSLCQQLSFSDERVSYLAQRMALTEKSISELWNKETHLFHSRDQITGDLCEGRVSGGLLPIYANLVNKEQLEKLIPLISEWVELSGYAVSSTHPKDDAYEPQRYWRGPIWLHINWMIADGLLNYECNELAEKIRISSKGLIEHSGYNESFHAETGDCSGGSDFSWTAAMSLYWLL